MHTDSIRENRWTRTGRAAGARIEEEKGARSQNPGARRRSSPEYPSLQEIPGLRAKPAIKLKLPSAKPEKTGASFSNLAV